MAREARVEFEELMKRKYWRNSSSVIWAGDL